jgi:molybdate transport system regulatory protein
MKTSARNQFAGQVTRVVAGAVNDEIEINVPGVGALVAIVTHGSAVNLGLQAGASAVALVKASSVIVVAQAQGAKFSARNHLQGQVTRVQKGAVNTEVVIGLPAGGAVAAIVTNESAEALGLAVGVSAAALFKASSVIVGVNA